MQIKRVKGFTLIEVVLAVSLFSMASVLVYSLFWGGIKLGHRFETSQTMYHESQWFFDIFSKELENMVVYDFSRSFPERTSFSGVQSRIAFLLPGEDGLKVIEYFLLPPEEVNIHEIHVNREIHKNVDVDADQILNDRSYFLVRKETGFIDFLQEDENAGQIEVIASSLKEEGLRFSYGVQKDLELEYVPEWADNKHPVEVRVEVDFVSTGTEEEAVTFKRSVYVPTGDKDRYARATQT